MPYLLTNCTSASREQRVHAGLYVCLWTSGALGFRPPGLTARLEVDYVAKLPSASLIQCSVSLDDIDRRKVWMRARVYDAGSGKECARARALFVAPRWGRVVRRVLWPFGRRAAE